MHQLDEKLWNAVAIRQPKPSIKRFHHAERLAERAGLVLKAAVSEEKIEVGFNHPTPRPRLLD